MMSATSQNVWGWFKTSLEKMSGASLIRDNSTARHSQLSNHKGPGKVFIIGAGPGDAELLTLKAHRLIQQADVVLYDWLVNPEVLAFVPASAKQVFVGKKCGRHSIKQADICQMMADYALSGHTVVRLKGGDPAIFARAAEECQILEQHQVEYAIVPGITAASGASAYAGIPLTHRECAQSVRFVTAHFKDPAHESDWAALVKAAKGSMGETLVFYMGLGRVEQISERLIEHGLTGDTPMAIIDQATDPQQQVMTCQLTNLSSHLKDYSIKGPALIVVGEVVNKRYNVSPRLLQAALNETHATDSGY